MIGVFTNFRSNKLSDDNLFIYLFYLLFFAGKGGLVVLSLWFNWSLPMLYIPVMFMMGVRRSGELIFQNGEQR